ncbi:MAG: DUF1850 domain-containing protein [Rhodospirillales bacterium]
MGAACLLIGAQQLLLASTAFTLSWTHSVEKTEWREDWVITENELRLTGARVRGSGAGMDPGDGARLQDGWWVWPVDAPAIPRLVLAASGATTGGWSLCHAGGCVVLGAEPGPPVRLQPCG